MLLAGRTLIGSLAALAVAGVALAGCAASGGVTSPQPPSQSASADPTHSTALPQHSSAASSPVADASAHRPGSTQQGVGMIGPVVVVPGQTEASVEVGRTIVVNVDQPTETVLSTDRPDLLELSQGRYDGSAWFNPGAQALAAGTATITLTQGDQARTITITITPAAR